MPSFIKIIAIKIDDSFYFEDYLHLLSRESVKKILSYRFRIDQIRSFTSEVLKYYYLADVLQIKPKQICIINTELGKPRLDVKESMNSSLHWNNIDTIWNDKEACCNDYDECWNDRREYLDNKYSSYHHPISDISNIDFSISHSGEYVVMAISDKPIGIDIEKIDAAIDVAGMAEMVFSESENNIINHNVQNFFLLWTKKEALFKAHGTGFINDYYNKTNLKLNLIEETAEYRIFSQVLANNYYVSLCVLSHQS